jgi:hypothetical protein
VVIEVVLAIAIVAVLAVSIVVVVVAIVVVVVVAVAYIPLKDGVCLGGIHGSSGTMLHSRRSKLFEMKLKKVNKLLGTDAIKEAFAY